MLPRLLVVSCGGTISSVSTGGGAASPALQAADLLAGLPQLAELADVEARSATTLASSALTLDDAVALHALLDGWVRDHGDDGAGIVVTHGTDTLAEVAYAVDLLWRHETPVVFTGAMRNASLPSADGPANVLAAAATAVAPSARGSGVLVVLDDRVHLAAAVRKSHTSALSTFVSATIGPAGYVVEGRARVVLHRRRPEPLPVPGRPLAQVPVALIGTPIGDDARLLEAVGAAGFAGLVVEALGGGHVPPAVASSAALAELLQRVPVVLASRVGAGEVLQQTYGFPGSETDLLARGLIPAGGLDGPKARVLLSLLLSTGTSGDEVRRVFAVHGSYGV